MKKIFLLTVITAIFSFLLTSSSYCQTPPRAYNVGIQGALELGSALSGIYSYSDTNHRPEGTSLYQWYRADSITQVNPVAIDSAWKISYVVDSVLDRNKFLAFQVTPVAQGTGDSLVGTPVRVWTYKMITATGIADKDFVAIVFYPNPVTNGIYIKNSSPIRSIGLYSINGTAQTNNILMSGNYLDLSALSAGNYLLRIIFENDKTGVARIVKN